MSAIGRSLRAWPTLRRITFFHAPQSRSLGVRILLEELGADYELHALSLKAEDQRSPAYLAVNPMGKVPAIRHDDRLVTEQVAIFLHLADLFPAAGLAPALGDPDRGPYLRWMVYYASCFEPAVVDRSLKREPAPRSTSPYGDFDTMLGILLGQLERGDYILGDRFSAADILWGGALRWTTMFGLVPTTPLVEAYIERVFSRPAVRRALEADEALVKAQQGG